MSQLPAPTQGSEPASDLERIIEGMPVWVQVCSPDGTIQAVNAAALRLSGYPEAEMIGQRWPYPWLSGAWSEGANNPFDDLARYGSVGEFEGCCRTKEGKEITLGISLSTLPKDNTAAPGSTPHQVMLLAWDLSQAQKIQAVSQLASGVAHDINNNLAVILGYAEFLLSTSESFGDVVRQALSAIQEQSIDCANTVRRIQLFSRTVSPSQFSRVFVNDVVDEVLETLAPDLQSRDQGRSSEITLVTELGDLPPVYAYQTGLREALLSVLKNAVEALPKGGTVTCTTRCQADEVVIEVKDDGVGVASLDLNRVFDAFFTAKGPACSGLGLSIAYNLITQQGGTIDLDSKEGHGTTCTIKLPAEAVGSGPAPLLPDFEEQNVLSVLVVDDEPMVADVFRTFLESSGHRAVTCLNGTYALQIFQEDDFDPAVVDLGMPNMDGWEFSRRIHEISPRFPIIVATGWNVSLEDGDDQGVSVQAVLKKPFGKQELTQAIDQAMEERRSR